jgi:hypothetical protein
MLRQRSPSSPFVNLARALALAEGLPRSKGFSFEEAAQTWGYDKKSSRVPQAISMLRQYNIIRVEGRGSQTRLQLTDLGRALLETRSLGDLQEAALNPTVFSSLWDRLRSGATSRDTLLHLLTRTYDYGPPFTTRAAEEVLRIFAENLAFARLVSEADEELVAELQSRPVVTEEILAMGKIRIQYRGVPDKKDFEEARAHFAAKAKRSGE